MTLTRDARIAILALLLATAVYIAAFPLPIGRRARGDDLQAAWERTAWQLAPDVDPAVVWSEATSASFRFLLDGERLDPGGMDLAWTCAATPEMVSICVDEEGGLARLQIARTGVQPTPLDMDTVRSQLRSVGFDEADGELVSQEADGDWTIIRLAREGSVVGETSWLEVRYDGLSVAEATRVYRGDAGRIEAFARRSDANIDASLWVFVVAVLFHGGPLIVGIVWLALRRPRELFRPTAVGVALALGVAALLEDPLQAAVVVGGTLLGLWARRLRPEPDLAAAVVAGTGWATIAVMTALAALTVFAASGGSSGLLVPVGATVAEVAAEIARDVQAGITEELAFRAAFLGMLVRWAGDRTALVVLAFLATDAVFACAHFESFDAYSPWYWRLIQTGAIGLVLSFAWWRHGAIAAIWAHAATNLVLTSAYATPAARAALVGVALAPAVVVGVIGAFKGRSRGQTAPAGSSR